ncbi:sensor domain-containing phosphodiesterase [Shewanella gaetbuli]
MDLGKTMISADSSAASTFEYHSSIERYSTILNMVLKGLPLGEILHALVLIIEAQKIGTKASVLLLSDDGKQLLSGAAPNLPNDYNEAINGVYIGPNVGSCGTAAFIRQRVIVEDIASHPHWKDYKALPLKAGLMACWSEPIFDSASNVLGTFAMYYDTIKSPTSQDLDLIQEAARLASLAIERSRSLHLQRLTSKIFDSLPISLVITNDKNSVLTANPTFENSTDYFDKEKSFFDIKGYLSQSDPQLVSTLYQTIERGHSWKGMLKGVKTSTDIRDIELVVTVIKDNITQQNCYAWMITDTTASKMADKLIEFQTYYDQLTGLANRKLLFKQLEQQVAADENNDNAAPFCLMILDLDHFKQVNDTLGADHGDEVLKQVAKKITQVLPENSLPSRIAADEFAVILPGNITNDELSALALAVNGKLSEEMVVAKTIVSMTSSIGFARYPTDANTAEQLLNFASQAMYSAKSNGRNCFEYFNQTIQLEAERTAQLHYHLKNAINLNELELYFQPIVDPNTTEINKAEALLRWHHDDQFISPDEFIPIAEKSGLIVEIGEWVRAEVVKMISAVQSLNKSICFSINVSTIEFCTNELQNRFLQSFEKVSQSSGLSDFPYHLVTLEITESLMMNQQQAVYDLLALLRKRGVNISIDDFGTGYSSLSYLVNFPVDQIKIDKAFIQQIETDERHKALIEAIVSMSNSLDLSLVAEGVETQEQLDFIKQLKIPAVQGYYYYKPMPTDEFLAIISQQE